MIRHDDARPRAKDGGPASDYYDSLPPPGERPDVLPPPPDTPDHLMQTWRMREGEPEPAPEPRRVRHTTNAVVVIHQGMTIVHCPRDACENAQLVWPGGDQEVDGAPLFVPRETMFHCVNCRYVAPVEWPDEYDAIVRELGRRPVPQTRNWYPADHPKAIAWGVPDGQSVADLRREFDENRSD